MSPVSGATSLKVPVLKSEDHLPVTHRAEVYGDPFLVKTTRPSPISSFTHLVLITDSQDETSRTEEIEATYAPTGDETELYGE